MTKEQDIHARATAWHLASFGDDMDWDAFTRWLEADPAHAQAFDEIALADAAALDHAEELSQPEVVQEEPAAATGFGWKRWAGAAIAASLVALVSVPLLLGDEEITRYRTTGESMTIALDDGSTILLAPDSELTVDGEGQQHLALSGGAWFDIRHDPQRALVVDAGPLSISDIGTQFDVQALGDNVRVAVAEGRVAVTSPQLSGAVELPAGRRLDFDGTSGKSVAAPINGASVGSWRDGQLSYSATPLSLVSADLSRYAGVELQLPEGLEDRLFSGTLAIDDGNSAIRDLSQLMGLAVERDGNAYRLREPAG